MNYYNEIDRKTAAWLRELIKAGLMPPGGVDERSITEVQPADLVGYTQCHFFAGIGGWPFALRLAGWPEHREVWTGSCPCQPFSNAGKQRGSSDARHLWPAWFGLIRQCKPQVVFGEQVVSNLTVGDGKNAYEKTGAAWIDEVFDDLERSHYSCIAIDLPSASVGRNHRRQRLWWVAYSASYGCEGLQRCAAPKVQENRTPQALASWDSLGNPFANWEEQLAMSSIRKLDDGVSSELVVRPALRGFGNAIDTQVAAEFIRAFLTPSPRNERSVRA